MQQFSIPLDQVTFGLFTSICNDTKNLELAKELLSAWQNGLLFKPSIQCCTQLISVFAKNCDPESALATFDNYCKTSMPDVILFNAIMTACIACNQATKSFELFKRMNMYSLSPDNRTYGILILACSETGNVEMAKSIFEKVKDRSIQVGDIDCNQLIKAFASSQVCLPEAFEVDFFVLLVVIIGV